MFDRLPEKTQAAWCRGFAVTTSEYADWASEATEALSAMPEDWARMPPLVEDLIEFIRPAPSWATPA